MTQQPTERRSTYGCGDKEGSLSGWSTKSIGLAGEDAAHDYDHGDDVSSETEQSIYCLGCHEMTPTRPDIERRAHSV